MHIVETTVLTRCFGTTAAVDQVSFHVSRGEIVGLLGPNGAGKTTVCRLLATVLEPTSGTAAVMGYDIRQHPIKVKENLALVPQGASLQEQFTLYENVFVYLLLMGMPAHTARTVAGESIHRFDLEQHKRKRPSQLSGGLRRRTQLARTLAVDRPLIVLDEPTTGLDPVVRRQAWDEIRVRSEQDCGILLLTQSMEEADALCDRVIFLNGGRILLEIAPADLDSQMHFHKLSILLPAPQIRPATAVVNSLPSVPASMVRHGKLEVIVRGPADTVLGTIREQGYEVREFSQEKLTLDDFYVALFGGGQPC